MFTPAGKRWIVVALVAVTAWFVVSMAFWACNRFSASSQTTLWGPSITEAETS